MTERLSNDESKRIEENIAAVRRRMADAAARAGRRPEDIRLVAVTKTMPSSAVNAAIDAGAAIIGENRVQELLAKLPDIGRRKAEFHIIGHLQTNKVRQIIDKVDMIQSLDSLHLAEEIEKQAARAGRIMDVLIEVNIGGEESKTGIAKEQALLLADELDGFAHIRLRGLMAVPPICDDQDKLRSYFKQMRKLFIDIKDKKSDNKNIEILSLGMSSDFEVAIEEGSTMVRVGTAIFGKRKYKEAAK